MRYRTNSIKHSAIACIIAQKISPILYAVSTLLLTGCATVLNGTTQLVPVSTDPPGGLP